MFGNLKTDTKPQEVADVEVEPPQWLKDIMITSQPLAAAFAFYRYYLLQPKYKAIVKFDLDHPAYFKKRDKLLELTQDDEFRAYFLAAILSFIGL